MPYHDQLEQNVHQAIAHARQALENLQRATRAVYENRRTDRRKNQRRVAHCTIIDGRDRRVNVERRAYNGANERRRRNVENDRRANVRALLAAMNFPTGS